jgi:V-type H+-transporting ATPase subunit a
MKLAIVIGVIHMVCGILLKGVNNIYFRSAMDFICEFIP